jgi:hypothetical protein
VVVVDATLKFPLPRLVGVLEARARLFEQQAVARGDSDEVDAPTVEVDLAVLLPLHIRLCRRSPLHIFPCTSGHSYCTTCTVLSSHTRYIPITHIAPPYGLIPSPPSRSC